MASSQGYKCEFIGSVFEDLYCKKCSLVARRLTIADCCGESFCQTCIADTREQGQPCPVCEEKEFTTIKSIEPKENQQSPGSLQHEGEGVCLVWTTGPVGHSLGPSPRQLPVCGHQVSPQLPTDHPQEQGGQACGSRVH